MLFSDCAFKTHELVASTCYILQFYYDKNTNSAQAHRIKTVYCLQSSIVMEKKQNKRSSLAFVLEASTRKMLLIVVFGRS